MNATDRLRLDYEHTLKYLFELAGVRFKLLAIVPVVTGLAIGKVDPDLTPGLGLAIGLFGFVVTLGLVFYDERNTQIYDAMQLRAKTLEAFIGFPVSRIRRYERTEWDSDKGTLVTRVFVFKRSGPLLDRPPRSLRFFGLLVWHDRGIALVYSAALAAWAYLAGAAADRLTTGGILARISLPLLVFFAVFYKYWQWDCETDRIDKLLPSVHKCLQAKARPNDQ
jgi:hypothetical protein